MKSKIDKASYENYSYETNKTFIHRSVTFASGLFLSFGILDYLIFDDIFLKLAAIRYGFFLPFVIILFLLLLLRPDFLKLSWGFVVSMIVLMASITTNFMQVVSGGLGHNIYFSGQLVIMLYVFAGSKFSFRWSFITGAGIIVLYNITMLFTHPEEYELLLLVKDNTFLIASFGLGAIMSYSMEQYLIKDYMNDLKVHQQLMEEIDQRKYSESQILYFANHDDLTGLFNRRYLLEELSSILKFNKEIYKNVAVIIMDIDNFKIINDSLGHEIGDQILYIISERLKVIQLDNALIARIGGDEFGILIKNETDLESILDRILQIFHEPFFVYPYHFHISTSIGVSLYPNHRTSSEDLIRCAESAMYHAKEHGKNRVEFFTEAYDVAIQKRGLIARKLNNAFNENDFYMVYQQKVDSENEIVRGLEALVRWEDPEEGFIPPDLFIKIAEETGFISTIGFWVIETACKEFMSLPEVVNKRLKLSVNLSMIELQQGDIAERVDQILKKYHMNPGNLCLEITESSIIQSLECVLDAIVKFKKIGVEVSIDDFGTGFSSLAYLSKLDVEELKVDRSFVTKIGVKEDDMIIRTIAALGKGLKLRVVAEGVETREQAEFLKEIGIDLLQGYLHGRPTRIEKWKEYYSLS